MKSRDGDGGGEQGWRSGESAYHSPGSIPPWCNMWVKYVVGCHHAARVPLRVLRLTFLHKKTTSPNSNSIYILGPALKPVKADAIFLFKYCNFIEEFH